MPFVLWLAMAVGVLIKGPIILMVVALASLVLSVKERSVRWLRPAADWRAAGLAMLIIRPGSSPSASIRMAPSSTTRSAATCSARSRVPARAMAPRPEPISSRPSSPYGRSRPLAIVAAPAVWRARGDDAVGFLLAWLVPSWLLFEAVPTKLPHYVLPLYPAIALLVAFAARAGKPLLRWKMEVARPDLPAHAGGDHRASPFPYATLLYGDRADIAGALLAAAAAGCAFLATLAFARSISKRGSLEFLRRSFLLFIGAYELCGFPG